MVALLVIAGILPARSGTVPAGAIFPLDVYFDVKHWLAFSDGWATFVAITLVSLMIRAGVLALTYALAGEAIVRSRRVWLESAKLVGLACLVFFPVAVLLFAGIAVRYAPFVWVGGACGVPAAVILLRAAIRMDSGDEPIARVGLPDLPEFVTYAWLIIAAGAAVGALGSISRLLAAALIALLGPLHALFLLGWRDNARTRTDASGGFGLTLVTASAVMLLLGAAVYDRYLRDAPPVSTARTPGQLLLLGGADSTSRTGALVDLEVRDVGYPPGRTRLLSYRSDRSSYRAIDTHADLTRVAEIVSRQIGSTDASRLLGHSQASLIVDRILDGDLTEPGASAVIAPASPYPPRLSVPDPGAEGTGKAGGDSVRALAKLLEIVGAEGFDVDAPASPTNLETVVVRGKPIPRLAIWALADSVLLNRDWRRPGEINVVAISDHVGATNDGRALKTVRRFFEGRSIEGDEASWRGALVVLVRYAFEPWRPA